MKKPKFVKVKAVVPKIRKRRGAQAELTDTGLPRITNDTVAAHRDEVLSSARKYIYPLQHTRHRIVLISTSIFLVAIVVFFVYCTLALYKLQTNSTFLYGVTRVIPFPIAKAGPRFVAYENYLFELRHYVHYYQTQQKVDFNSASGKQQLADFKHRALQQVVDNAYVKQLAAKNHITVSDRDVDNEVSLVRNQNRLGTSDQVFEDVLKEFWGWTVDDFKRELKEQLLAQKVVSTLDTTTQARARAALAQLADGADFTEVAKQTSDDASAKSNSGVYPGAIDKSNRDVAPQVVDALFKLKPGETSGIINTGYSLEIVKLIDTDGTKVHAAHISFTFKDIKSYINDLKDKQKARLYLNV